MTFGEFLETVHKRYQAGGATVPFSECFVTELRKVRPELVPKQRVNRRVRVSEQDFLRIRKCW